MNYAIGQSKRLPTQRAKAGGVDGLLYKSVWPQKQMGFQTAFQNLILVSIVNAKIIQQQIPKPEVDGEYGSQIHFNGRVTHISRQQENGINEQWYRDKNVNGPLGNTKQAWQD